MCDSAEVFQAPDHPPTGSWALTVPVKGAYAAGYIEDIRDGGSRDLPIGQHHCRRDDVGDSVV